VDHRRYLPAVLFSRLTLAPTEHTILNERETVPLRNFSKDSSLFAESIVGGHRRLRQKANLNAFAARFGLGRIGIHSDPA
jgi:hypothetical protein